jgi:hypothetical protein
MRSVLPGDSPLTSAYSSRTLVLAACWLVIDEQRWHDVLDATVDCYALRGSCSQCDEELESLVKVVKLRRRGGGWQLAEKGRSCVG